MELYSVYALLFGFRQRCIIDRKCFFDVMKNQSLVSTFHYSPQPFSWVWSKEISRKYHSLLSWAMFTHRPFFVNSGSNLPHSNPIALFEFSRRSSSLSLCSIALLFSCQASVGYQGMDWDHRVLVPYLIQCSSFLCCKKMAKNTDDWQCRVERSRTSYSYTITNRSQIVKLYHTCTIQKLAASWEASLTSYS